MMVRDEGRGTRVLEPDAARRDADGGVFAGEGMKGCVQSAGNHKQK